MTRRKKQPVRVTNQPTQNHERCNAEPNPNKGEGEVAKEIRGFKELFRAFVDKQAATEEKQEQADKGKRNLELRAFWVVAVYTVLTFGLFVVGFCQLHESQVQTVAENRAWLYPENFKFTIRQNGPLAMIEATGDNQNVGKDPAIDVLFGVADVNFIPINAGDSDGRDYKIPTSDICSDDIKWISKTKPLPFQDVVFPGQQLSYDRPVILNPLDNSLISGVQNGTAIFYLRDCVAYRTLGELHATPFCFYYIRDFVDGSMKTYHCPHGNEAN